MEEKFIMSKQTRIINQSKVVVVVGEGVFERKLMFYVWTYRVKYTYILTINLRYIKKIVNL